MKQVNVRFSADEMNDIDAWRATSFLKDAQGIPTRPEALRILVGVAFAAMRGDEVARVSRDLVVTISKSTLAWEGL